MMKAMQKSACALAILATTTLPALADSVDFTVKGTITPSACVPTIAGGGAIDYGDIKAEKLSPDNYTVLDVKSVEFSINCDAPTKVAIKAINNRAGSNATGEEGIGGAAISPAGLRFFGNQSSLPVTGLGLDGTTKIGGYATRFTLTAIADGVAATTLRSIDDKNTWLAQSVSQPLYGTDTLAHLSWTKTNAGTEPEALTTLSAEMDIQAYINKTSELDLSKPVELDGSTTIELVYL
ncbi:DUF1120 domain-containing protein [Pantoea sp.]|uniref:DUF1120 domain-containing protein n=1 Tax=Pantoea sp. TaxID=69393 RepID=UPI0031D39A77